MHTEFVETSIADQRRDLLEYLLEPGPTDAQVIGSWPRVISAIHRGDIFIVEAESPAQRLRLAYCPERPDSGNYEIRARGGQPESGRTVEIKVAAPDESNGLLGRLRQFPVRVIARTVGGNRSNRERFWWLGITEFHRVAEEGDE